MQHKISNGPLLDETGSLSEPGYAFSLVKDYNRKDIKVVKIKIKEWDYYYIGNKDYGIALTVADNSYMGLLSVSILDFRVPYQITKSKLLPFTFGKLHLPSSSISGDIEYEKKGYVFKFLHEGNKRHLIVKYPKFKNDDAFECDVTLSETMKDSMVIATPFNKKKHFYYNQKINCLKATGSASIGHLRFDLSSPDTFGVLDWGRGVWTYKNTWYWSSLNSTFEGHNIGFNLGYGFGNTSAASENMFFYDDKAYKLEDVKFNIPSIYGKDCFMKKWTITDLKGNINLIFEPIIDRYMNTNVLLIQSCQHQVFGKFSGVIKLDNKTEIKFKDLPGFAEKVYNRW